MFGTCLGSVWNFLILIINILKEKMETNVELVWDFQRTFRWRWGGDLGEVFNNNLTKII